MTDADPFEARARSVAARLLAAAPASPPSIGEAQRRQTQRKARHRAAAAGFVAVIGLAGAVPHLVGQWPQRDLDVASAADAPHGESTSPAPSDAVDPEVDVFPTAHAVVPTRPSVAPRAVAGPWQARIAGGRIVLRNQSTHTTVMQRITFLAPGQFLVHEPPEGLTASFGCTADGRYSWELANDSLKADPIDDPCEARVAVLTACAIDPGLLEAESPPPPETPVSSPAPSDDEGIPATTTVETPPEGPSPSPGSSYPPLNVQCAGCMEPSETPEGGHGG
jgi:hypothetical protein